MQQTGHFVRTLARSAATTGLVTTIVMFACTACSRDDSSAPQSGSGPIHSVGDTGGAGGGANGQPSSGGGGGAGAAASIGGGAGGGGSASAGGNGEHAVASDHSTRKSRPGGGSGASTDDTASNDPAPSPPSTLDATLNLPNAGSFPTPNQVFNADVNPAAPTSGNDPAPLAATTPLPPTAWAGLFLLAILAGTVAIRSRQRSRASRVE